MGTSGRKLCRCLMRSRCARANGDGRANALGVLATDRGYSAKALRQKLRQSGIRAQIPKRVWQSKQPRGRPIKQEVPRFQAERTFAWFQKKYRRWVVRWERLVACFEAFLAIATIHIWIQRLIVG